MNRPIESIQTEKGKNIIFISQKTVALGPQLFGKGGLWI